MKRVRVEIEGIAPILFNKMTSSALSQLDSGGRGKKKDRDAQILNAKDKVYREKPKGPIGIPSGNFKKALLEGCKMAGAKVGRKSAEPFMRATVFPEKDFISFGKKKEDGIHECTGRVPPRTGGRVIIRRPYLKEGWKASFSLLLMDDRITSGIVKESLEEAGLLIGLCDHRPEFGRFKVNKFDVE
jgi:hypothetical protein